MGALCCTLCAADEPIDDEIAQSALRLIRPNQAKFLVDRSTGVWRTAELRELRGVEDTSDAYVQCLSERNCDSLIHLIAASATLDSVDGRNRDVGQY